MVPEDPTAPVKLRKLAELRIHDRLEVLKALPSTKNEAQSRIWRGLAISIGLSLLAELATKSLSSTAPLPRLDPLEVKDRPAHLGPADALESKSRSDMVKIAELPHPVAFEFSLPRVRSLVLQRTRTCCRAVLSQRGWLQLCYICYIASLCRLEVKHC